MHSPENKKDEQIHYCKKCGCELASTSKRKMCENCRRQRNAKIREFGGAALAFGAVVLPSVLKLLGNLSENTDIEKDDEEDAENTNIY